MDRIKIIIVDDHPIFSQGVADSLSLEPDLEVIAQADTGEKALELIRKLTPDVAILDINLPGIHGLQVVRQIRSEKLLTRVILLTAYADSGQRLQGLQQGAAAFCTKDIQPELLAEVVRVVAAGKYWIEKRAFTAEEVQLFLEGVPVGKNGEIQESGRFVEPLSSREMEILTCIARGMSNKEIAVALGISHQTVKNHVTAVLHKLNVNDRTQAALLSLQYGWVRLTD